MKLPFLIAHRGASADAPENTLAAMRRAAALGASWVEFDVMPSADNRVMVFHDESLERTTNGRGLLADKDYEQLRRLDAGGWFDSAFKQEKIPELGELLTLCAMLKLHLNIELKPTPGAEEKLVSRVLSTLATHWVSPLPPPLFSSFSLTALQALRRADPRVLIGLLLDEWRDDWATIADQLHSVSVHLNHAIVTPERVNAIHRTERQVLVYTVNSKVVALQLGQWGVDGIFTDKADLYTQDTSFSRSILQ